MKAMGRRHGYLWLSQSAQCYHPDTANHPQVKCLQGRFCCLEAIYSQPAEVYGPIITVDKLLLNVRKRVLASQS
jgi:hypothetical protein